MGFLERFLRLSHRRSQLVRWGLGFAIALLIPLLYLGSVNRVQAQPVRVTLLMQALEASRWQPLVKDFETQHPDIDLDIIEGPTATNLVEDLYTASFLLGDSPYDLVYMDIVWVPKFAAAGWLLDLSDRLSPETEQALLAGDLNGGRYQTGLYRIPFRSDGGMLYYRRDLLEAAGLAPPDTMAELIEISKTLQTQGQADWGYVWQGRQYEGLAAMFVELLAGYGGFWVNADTLAVGLDQPEAIAAVEALQQLVAQGISPPGVTNYQEEEARRLFQSGNTVFMRNWPYAWPLGNAEDSPVAGKIAIKPMVHADGYRSGACQGGWGLGIAKTSQHPDAAWQVIEFFTSADVQRQFILDNGYVPSRRALFTDPEIVARYRHYPELLNVIESAVLRPPIAQYAQASDILQRYLSTALTGRQSPTAAMKAAAAETRRLLQRGTP